MPNLTNQIPEVDIQRQLDNMLQSKRFRMAPNRSDFLKLVVARALAGKSSTEAIIGRTLFREKFLKDECTDVRVTAINLRLSIKKYYEAEGRDDPVIIDLPVPPEDKTIVHKEGDAYTPIFAVNPRLSSSVALRRGKYHLAKMSQIDYNRALDHFQVAASSKGNIADSFIGNAESMFAMAIHDARFVDPREVFNVAQNQIDHLLQKKPDNWHPHAAMGALHLCQHKFAQASHEFQIALSLDRHHVERYGWYAAFLMTTGKTRHALDLVRMMASERVEDPLAQAFYGLFLYLVRRYEESESLLNEALGLDPHCWLAHITLGFLYATIGSGEKGIDHLMQLLVALKQDHTAWIMPGLIMLCTARAASLDDETLFRNLFLTEAALFDVAKRRDPFQIALGSIAAMELTDAKFKGKYVGADLGLVVEYLDTACDELSPLTLWLRLWPILDPLRDDPRFQKLLNNRGLPPLQTS
jgi:tetratricopeptide (TPR) repeat protein